MSRSLVFTSRHRFRVGFALSLLLALAALLSGCGGGGSTTVSGGTSTVTRTYREAGNTQQICFLITISDVPKGSERRVTVLITGALGQVGTHAFKGGNGTYKFCVNIPGDAIASTVITVNVYGSDPADPEPRPRPTDAAGQTQWDKDSKKWAKETVVNGSPVSSVPDTPPTLPEGTITPTEGG